MQMVHITLHTEDPAQVEALKSVMKALKIKFEISKEKSYDPGFVAKINKGRKDFEEGKGTPLSIEDFRNLWK